MRIPNFYKIFRWTVSIQIITGWTILVVASYFISEIWFNNILTHLILWFVGAMWLGLVFSWNYMGSSKGKDVEDGQIGSLIYHAIADASPDSVAATDLLGNYIFANKQTALLHGYDTTDEFIGKNAFSLFPLNEVLKAAKYRDMTLSDGIIKNIEFNLLRKDGSTFPAEMSVALIKNEFGMPVAFIAITRDITERKHIANQRHDINEQLRLQLVEIEKLQSTLKEQAIQDPLTGLYNRRYMEEALKQEFARARRENQPFSVVMMDMDNLKTLNDGHGHMVGDDAIKSLATLFRKLTRIEDTVCRYGGDEYLVILHNADAKIAQIRIQEWTERAKEIKIYHEGKVLEVGFSAGMATYPIYESIDKLIQAADEALYNAKGISKRQKKTDSET